MLSTFARLEYGKLCVSTTGAILSHAESGVLAATPDFPAPLQPLCTPRLTGPDDEPDRLETAQRFGSSMVIVPVLAGGRLVRVGARFRRRPEPGEGVEGRSFWRATFLSDGSAAADMAALGLALSEATLSGWTEVDVVTPVSLGARAAAALPAGLDGEAWVATASHFVIAGVAIGVREGLAAAPFFALAALLEAELPRKLRGLCSAGWGVAAAYAAGMTISLCRGFPAGIAVYDAERHHWSHDRNQVGALLAEQRGGRRHEARGDDGAARGVTIRFDSGEASRWTQQVRDELFDERGVQALRSWLDTDGAGAPPPASYPDLRTTGARVRYLDLLVSGLTLAPQRARAEAALLDVLRGPGRGALVERARVATPVHELEVLRAVVEDQPERLIASLRGHARPLGPWTLGHLRAALDATLVPVPESRVAAHGESLSQADTCHPAYLSWATAKSDTLALLLGRVGPPGLRSRALAALADRSGSSGAALVLAIDSGPPLDVTEARARLASVPKWSTVLAQLARRRWNEAATADDRAAALCWLRALGAEPDDPILRRGAPGAGDATVITRALADGTVPNELLDRLAPRVLSEWSGFREEVVSKWYAWEGVLCRWPPHLVALLVPRAVVTDWSPVLPGVHAAMAAMAPGAADLESMGREAADQGLFENARGGAAAALFIAWCGLIKDSDTGRGLVDSVRWLWHGAQLPAFAPDSSSLAPIGWLYRLQPPAPEARRSAWLRATNAETLLLLLRLFGGPIEALTVRQQELLLERPLDVDALADADPAQDQHLATCRLDWQSIDLRRGPDPRWRPEYARTLLTGLFAGISREDEAPLADLLEVFGRRSGCSRAELATRYLRGRRPEDLDQARRDVWREVVESECLTAGLDPSRFESLVIFGEAGHEEKGGPPRGPRAGRHINIVDWYRVPVTEINGQLCLHPSFAALLLDIGDRRLRAERVESYRGAPLSSLPLPAPAPMAGDDMDLPGGEGPSGDGAQASLDRVRRDAVSG